MVTKSKEMYSECEVIHGQINWNWWKHIVAQFLRHDYFIMEENHKAGSHDIQIYDINHTWTSETLYY